VTAPAAAAVEPPPRLLRESKAMTAALAMLEKGIKFLYRKDFKRARSEFNSLIESHPGETEILARTRSYLQICDKEELMRKKVGVTTSDFYSLGVIEHNRRDYEGAIGSFQKALEQHPDAEHIYYSLAASLALKGETSEAIQVLRRAIVLNEDNRIYAKNDTDFNALHTNKDFVDLVGMSHNPAGVSNQS
jgi:tetratricopeptide (TPR) repeat protein